MIIRQLEPAQTGTTHRHRIRDLIHPGTVPGGTHMRERLRWHINHDTAKHAAAITLGVFAALIAATAAYAIIRYVIWGQ